MIADAASTIGGADLATWVKALSAVGVTGLLVAIVYGGVREKAVWVPGSLYRRTLAERDQALARNADLNELMATQVVPALTRATDTQKDLVPLVQEALALMRAKP